MDADVKVCLVWLGTKNFLGKPDGTFLAVLLCHALYQFFRVCSLMSPARKARRGGQAKIPLKSQAFAGKKESLSSREKNKNTSFFLFHSLLSGDKLIPFSSISWSMFAFCSGWEQHSKWKELVCGFSMV